MERTDGEIFAIMWTICSGIAAVLWTLPTLLQEGFLEPWGVLAFVVFLVSAVVWWVRSRLRRAYRPRPTHDDLD